MRDIPDTFAIEWLVGNLHVGTPDHKVEEMLRKRIPPDVPALTADNMVKYAIKVHHQNQDLYRKVMGSYLG